VLAIIRETRVESGGRRTRPVYDQTAGSGDVALPTCADRCPSAHLSHYVSLQPSDMITSGTGPSTAIEGGCRGNRWLKPADTAEVEVEGAGATLTNTVAKW